jgi:hypothetical protein
MTGYGHLTEAKTAIPEVVETHEYSASGKADEKASWRLLLLLSLADVNELADRAEIPQCNSGSATGYLPTRRGGILRDEHRRG